MTKTGLLFVLQAGAILGWAGYEEHVRRASPTFRVPLQPSDPYDLLRGRYFVLNPVDAVVELDGPANAFTPAEVETLMRDADAWRTEALVGFCPNGDVHRVCGIRVAGRPPVGKPTGLWARGRVSALYPREPRRLDVELGLDRFFIPNRAVLPARENEPGWELEVSHRPGRTLLPRRLWFRGKPVDF
jgi:hypothetical protein